MKKTAEILGAHRPTGTAMGALSLKHCGVAIAVLTFFVAVCVLSGSVAFAQAPEQSTYASPDEAMQALARAAEAKDRAALSAIFGPDEEQLLSGDDLQDTQDLNDFAKAVTESSQLEKESDSMYTMVVGKDSYPMPIPIVERQGKWLFDTKAGLDEVLTRRIGENELSAISICRTYAVAQWEYFTEGDWDNDGVAEYAQRLLSTPGEHNGLYWETAEGETLSPLGQLVADAREEGYRPRPENPGATDRVGNGLSTTETRTRPRRPYHGYYLKILKAQGPHAPGGKYSYVINGNMIAGYALVAYPDRWGNSGVMTFIINQQGRVYQKNLGSDTAKLAAAMTEYDPDLSWKLVDTQP